MEDVLYYRQLFKRINWVYIKLEKKTDDRWKKLNKKDVCHIRQWVDQSVFHHVNKDVDAYSFQMKLERLYE